MLSTKFRFILPRAFRGEKIWNRPTSNNNCIWRPCLLMDQGEMRNLYGGPFIDDSYKVSVQMWKLWMVWGWSCAYYNTKYWRLTTTHSFKGQRSKNCSYWLFKINKFEKLICKSFNVNFYICINFAVLFYDQLVLGAVMLNIDVHLYTLAQRWF